MYRWVFALAASTMLLGTACPRTAGATDIVSCGTTVAEHDTGVLQNDLDCQSGLFAIRLLRHATLDLNGHHVAASGLVYVTILGVATVDDDDPVEAGKGRFTIVGPGEISGTIIDPNLIVGTQGCVVLQNGRATITSATGTVDIHDCFFGVVGYLPDYSTNSARATLDHVTLHDHVFEGVTVKRLVASNVASHGNHGVGVHSNSIMTVTDVVAYDNAIGLFAARRMRGTGITATNNSSRGISSFGRVDLTDLVATGNGLFGVDAVGVRLTDSNVTGNAVGDVTSDTLPVLVNTTCGTSLQSPGPGTWGVCAND
jgi:hypothetical protein